MEPTKQEKKLTREEFDRITAEIQALVGDKLRNHKDGDAERLLFEEFPSKKRRAGSGHAGP